MSYLLDTCTFLWLTSNPEKLSTRVYNLLLEPEHKFYLSAVSAVEICVKSQTGKLKLKEEPKRFIKRFQKKYELIELPVFIGVSDYLTKLSLIHKDPFDPVLIAQALEQKLTILTPDEYISQYDLPVLW